MFSSEIQKIDNVIIKNCRYVKKLIRSISNSSETIGLYTNYNKSEAQYF